MISINDPLISIVTIVFNDVQSIEQTMLSVINQSYKNIEYIVIDGGSNDGTVDIIKKFDNNINYWCSEPDKGIYDAMNKGIDRASGEWIIFINSGDRFYNESVLSNVFSQNHTADVLYGDTMMHYEYGNIVLVPHKLQLIEKHMIFAHTSTFTRTKLMKEHKFNCKYRIAADDDFFYMIYKSGYKFEYIPICVSYFDRTDTGISKSYPKIAKQESDIIRGKSINFVWNINFYINYYTGLLRSYISSLLPEEIQKKRRIKSLTLNERVKKINL
jgi:glycosyltransferase involved in cell wall biosynthesis